MTEYHFTFKLTATNFVAETWGILSLLEHSFPQFGDSALNYGYVY